MQVPNFLDQTKRLFPFSFCADTKSFGAVLNVIQFLVRPKKFGPAENILGHVEGQDWALEGCICFFSKVRTFLEDHKNLKQSPT